MAAVIANRIDYDGGRSDQRRGALHDLMTEAQKPGVSRLIFIPLPEQDHYADCNDCQKHLMSQWGWPEYLFRPTCHLSNGYALDTVIDANTGDEKFIQLFRCLVKQIDLTKDYYGKLETKYEWLEMTITMRQHQNGSVSLICFGVPTNFHTSFAAALIKVAADKQWKTDGEHVAAALMQEVVGLYDKAVWSTSKAVRTIEKGRLNDEYNFEMMHELLRHVIHITETLQVAVDSLDELNYDRLDMLSHQPHQIRTQHDPTTQRPQMRKHFNFWCRLLKNFARRSDSNKMRLQNEINLALNLVTQKDSRATIELSHAASRDSAAMRTISIVTLIFLPATFVASIFGTSFFNYQGPTIGTDQPWSISDKFWVFWAWSVPLTLVTLGVWLMGQWWMERTSRENFLRRKTTFMVNKGLDGDKSRVGSGTGMASRFSWGLSLRRRDRVASSA